MVSSRAKGMRNERRAQKELEAEGWLIHRARGSTMYNREVDIFGIWDMLGIKQVYFPEPKTIIICVQIKTNRKPNRDVFRRFKQCYPSINCQLWIWWEKGKRKSKKGWEKIIL